jgi:hypothetical protein
MDSSAKCLPEAVAELRGAGWFLQSSKDKLASFVGQRGERAAFTDSSVPGKQIGSPCAKPHGSQCTAAAGVCPRQEAHPLTHVMAATTLLHHGEKKGAVTVVQFHGCGDDCW